MIGGAPSSGDAHSGRAEHPGRMEEEEKKMASNAGQQQWY
jgi:hypothetical protein